MCKDYLGLSNRRSIFGLILGPIFFLYLTRQQKLSGPNGPEKQCVAPISDLQEFSNKKNLGSMNF